MLPASQDQAPPQAAGQNDQEAPKSPEVDLQALASEILALLIRELQQEWERSGRG